MPRVATAVPSRFPCSPPLKSRIWPTDLPKPTRTFSPCPATVRPISSGTPTPPVCPASPPAAVYIHLPFCRRRCHYCDFPIVALGSSHRLDDDPRISSYIHLLLREIRATKPYSFPHSPVNTVFFGGGTPSLVPPRLVESVFDAIRARFGGVAADAEVSMEMDPGTFDAARLEEMVGVVGVTRVSLGVQAFQEDLLRACGRAHGRSEVDEAIKLVAGCGGIKSWSLDLISSLPRQTEEMWKETLQLAVAAGPPHLSVYDLQVEQGTKFAQLYTPGEFPLPTESQSADLYKMASETLKTAGYHHYEISSFSKPGHECQHNLAYWMNQPFYGFGLGSASYVNGVRFSRPRSLKEYERFVNELESGSLAAAAAGVEAKDLALDVVMLSLRIASGLDLRDFARLFGEPVVLSLCRAWRQYVESGHVIALDKERKFVSFDDYSLELNCGRWEGQGVVFVRLSDPEGFLISNEVIAVAFGVLCP